MVSLFPLTATTNGIYQNSYIEIYYCHLKFHIRFDYVSFQIVSHTIFNVWCTALIFSSGAFSYKPLKNTEHQYTIDALA